MSRLFRRLAIAATAIATMAALSGAAAHEMDRPGFLSFSASRTLLRSSHSVTVDVGLKALRDGQGGWHPASRDDVWFQITIDDSELGEPGRRRWTNGRTCPAAMAELDKVRDLAMPRPVLPIPAPNGEYDADGDIYLDGRVYSLDIRSANLNGQAIGTVSMSSNLDTDLARWVERMLVALEPCWSRTLPADMDSDRGTEWDARYHGPLRQADR